MIMHLYSIEIMRSHADQRPPPAHILMQMVLCINEALIIICVELEIPQNTADHVWTNSCGGRRLHVDGLQGGGGRKFVGRWFREA